MRCFFLPYIHYVNPTTVTISIQQKEDHIQASGEEQVGMCTFCLPASARSCLDLAPANCRQLVDAPDARVSAVILRKMRVIRYLIHAISL